MRSRKSNIRKTYKTQELFVYLFTSSPVNCLLILQFLDLSLEYYLKMTYQNRERRSDNGSSKLFISKKTQGAGKKKEARGEKIIEIK